MGHSWQDKLAFVGLTWAIDDHIDDFVRVHVRIPGGAVAFGGGGTVEEALQSGAHGHAIDWDSVERKMTDAAWAEIAHC